MMFLTSKGAKQPSPACGRGKGEGASKWIALYVTIPHPVQRMRWTPSRERERGGVRT